MSWKTQKKRSSDPFEKRRRELEEQARSLIHKKAALEAELNPNSQPPKKVQPPTWKLSSEGESYFRDEEPLPSINRKRSRTLSIQRHRDRNLFIGLAIVLLLVLFWVFKSFIF